MDVDGGFNEIAKIKRLIIEVKNMNLLLANFNQQDPDSNSTNSNSNTGSTSTPDDNNPLPPHTQTYSRGPRH